MRPIIEMDHVTFGYGTAPVLQDVSLHLHFGQFAALVGPSGAGKTTFLKMVTGLLRPTYGSVVINGHKFGDPLPPRIGYVPQIETVDWNFPVTVGQVVLMGVTNTSGLFPWVSRNDRRRADELLEELGIGGLGKRHIRDLSGGQQQRVFLARALISNPDLLVLDEPTAGVDMRTAESVLHTLAHLNREGLSILMTTHDLNAAAAHIPWVICLNRRVIAQGAPEDVYTEAILNETYQGDFFVIRQDDMLIVQQRPHHHSHRDILPNPTPGEMVL